MARAAAFGSDGERSPKAVGPGASNDDVRTFTVKEVAKLLRVCTATVYSMVERGELPHVRVSNSIRIVVSRGADTAVADETKLR